MGVLGNEQADWLAKVATKHEIDNAVNIPKSFYKKIMKEKMDNARPHIFNLVENFLEDKTIQSMEWLACSSDLNPFQHVWDTLGKHVSPRLRPPVTWRTCG
ncbi:hypothetical protein TNCV_5129781 [Trichonephila clavipes]|nr:hypothetical protein TNCV_5129781 [Trichonephila clavipes]